MHGILSACIINPSNLSSILSHKINTDWMRLRFIVSIPVVVVVVDLDDVGVAVAVHVYSCIVFFLWDLAVVVVVRWFCVSFARVFQFIRVFEVTAYDGT